MSTRCFNCTPFTSVAVECTFCVCLSAIIERVRNREAPAFRPALAFDNVDDVGGSRLVLIIQRCWTENPSDRPSFEEVTKMIKKLGSRK